jgi:hypothetical protein
MASRFNRSQATTCVLCQWDPKGRSNMVPIGAEAALRSPHDNQEVEALLLDAHSLGRVRSAISTSPPEQRSNREDCSMGSGDQPV